MVRLRMLELSVGKGRQVRRQLAIAVQQWQQRARGMYSTVETLVVVC